VTGWHIERIKRSWVPEWLWRAVGQAVLRRPLRGLLSRDLKVEEAATLWREEDLG
jgi:hypothetical protein